MIIVNGRERALRGPGGLVQEMLERARILLMEKGWCQERAAEDAQGRGVNETYPMACRFCLIGAMWRAVWEMRIDSLEYHMLTGGHALISRVGNLSRGIVPWNDQTGRTVTEVIDLLDRAILEESRE